MTSHAGADAWTRRFELVCRCRLCGAEVDIGRVSPSLDRTAPMSRIVVVAVPEVCSECRSLEVVK